MGMLLVTIQKKSLLVFSAIHFGFLHTGQKIVM